MQQNVQVSTSTPTSPDSGVIIGTAGEHTQRSTFRCSVVPVGETQHATFREDVGGAPSVDTLDACRLAADLSSYHVLHNRGSRSGLDCVQERSLPSSHTASVADYMRRHISG